MKEHWSKRHENKLPHRMSSLLQLFERLFHKHWMCVAQGIKKWANKCLHLLRHILLSPYTEGVNVYEKIRSEFWKSDDSLFSALQRKLNFHSLRPALSKNIFIREKHEQARLHIQY